jgi:polysaccharide deacetylase 2 family uncharacterized protein YibQ
MFSTKPPPKPAPPPGPGLIERARAGVMTAVANPYLSASGAAFLFLLMLATLIFLTGDPKAGTPTVRLNLMTVASGPTAPPGWRQALSAEVPGEAPLTADTYALSPVDTDGGPPTGEAVITMPGGGPAGAGGMPSINSVALAQAPIAGFTAQGPGGLLPIISADGRTPAQAYARPFVSNGKPKVALIIGGLGLNAQQTRTAIETLPAEVTLSFVPYAEGLQSWIDMARAAGHEVLLEAPMEPLDYPNNDPGPFTLMTDAQPQETTRKLEWLLSRCTGYFGVTNYLGSKFVTSTPAMTTFSQALRLRGLAFIDDGSAFRQKASYTQGLPRASAERLIDEALSPDTISAQLAQLEAGAMQRGQALGAGFAYPVTIEVAGRWAQGLAARGYQLAPASALMRRG